MSPLSSGLLAVLFLEANVRLGFGSCLCRYTSNVGSANMVGIMAVIFKNYLGHPLMCQYPHLMTQGYMTLFIRHWYHCKIRTPLLRLFLKQTVGLAQSV
jgi:hypothetical protein